MKDKKHIVIFSHGHGVKKDDLGLLIDIAEKIPEAESVLFDYYDIDEENKAITICPISEQVKKLENVISEVKEKNPNSVIDLIGHSMGTLIPAIAKPEGIRKTILLAPVFDLSIEHTLKRYASRPNAEINLEGMSRLPVLDGYVRFVPKECWIERKNVKPFEEYNFFAEKTELIIINANQDIILPKVDLGELNTKIKLTSLDGDHSFNGKDRDLLLKTIREIILD